MTVLGMFFGIVGGWLPLSFLVAVVAGPWLARNAKRYPEPPRVIEAGDLYRAMNGRMS